MIKTSNDWCAAEFSFIPLHATNPMALPLITHLRTQGTISPSGVYWSLLVNELGLLIEGWQVQSHVHGPIENM